MKKIVGKTDKKKLINVLVLGMVKVSGVLAFENRTTCKVDQTIQFDHLYAKLYEFSNVFNTKDITDPLEQYLCRCSVALLSETSCADFGDKIHF